MSGETDGILERRELLRATTAGFVIPRMTALTSTRKPAPARRAALAALALFAAAGSAEAFDEVPAPDALKVADRLLESVLDDRLKDGVRRTPADVAKYVLEEVARKEKDPAVRYAAFRETISRAMRGNAFLLAHRAFDELCEHHRLVDILARDPELARRARSKTMAVWTIDELAAAARLATSLEEKVDTLMAASDIGRSGDLARRVAIEQLSIAVECFVRGAAAHARTLARSSVRLAGGHSATRRLARRMLATFDSAVAESSRPEVNAALRRTKSKPSTAEHNRLAGRYLMGGGWRWKRALALLRRCDDAVLVALAKSDAANPTSFAQRLELADRWRDRAAEETESHYRDGIARRALHWYTLALGDLRSISERRVREKTLEKIEELRRTHDLWEVSEIALARAKVIFTFEPDTVSGTKDRIVKDQSGYGFVGALRGKAAVVEGIAGSGLRFDGNSRVRVERTDALRFTRRMTATAWIRSDHPEGAICVQHRSGPNGCFVFSISRGRFFFGASPRPHLSDPIADGEWHHVVGVYDSSAGRVAHYIDGELVASFEEKLPLPNKQFGTRVGNESSHRWYFRGTIDEVALIPRALSPREVNSLFERGRAGRPLAD